MFAHILAVMRRSVLALSTVLGVCVGALALAPTTAEAAPNVKRRGGQFEGMVGGSLCIPGTADCKSSDNLAGKTGPSFGMGFTLGYRPIRSLMIGGAYNLGFFNPSYRNGAVDVYKSAYQNSLFGVIRGIIPVWRIDIGLELAPGWSRQTFKVNSGLSPVLGNKQFSQGFALKTAPMIDFFITRQLFIGAKFDFIFNFHRQVCVDYAEGNRTCAVRDSSDQASVHQMILGFHIGGTF